MGNLCFCSLLRARKIPAQWEDPRAPKFADKLFKEVNLRARINLSNSLRNRGLTHKLFKVLQIFLRAHITRLIFRRNWVEFGDLGMLGS